MSLLPQDPVTQEPLPPTGGPQPTEKGPDPFSFSKLVQGERQSTPEEAAFRIRQERARQLSPQQAMRVLKIGSKTGMDEDLILESLNKPQLRDIEATADEPGFDPDKFRKTDSNLRQLIESSTLYMSVMRDGKLYDKTQDLEKTYWRKDDPLRPLSDQEIEAMSQREAKFLAPKLYGAGQSLGAGDMPNWFQNVYHTLEEAEAAALDRSRGRIRDEERFVQNLEKVGFGEKFSLDVPLFSSVFEASRMYDLYRAAKRKETGQASEYDQDLLLRYARYEQAAQRRGTSILGKVSGIVGAAPAIIGEFALSGPAAAVGKEGVEQTFRKVFKDILGERFGSIVRRGVGTAVGAAGVQTGTVGLPHIAGGTLRRLLPGIEITPDQEGKLGVALNDEEVPGVFGALVKAVGEQYFETVSEYSGAGIAKLVAPVKTAVMTRWLKLQPNRTVQDFLAKVNTSAGWNGVLGEVFEERVSEFLREGTGVSPETKLTFDQLAAEVIGFAAIGAPGAAASLASSRKVTLPPRMPLLTTPEDFQAMGKTVEEIKKAVPEPEVANEILGAIAGNDTFQMSVREHQTYAQSVKDEDGRAIDPKEMAIELGVTPEDYDEAIRLNANVVITGKAYLQELAGTEHNAFYSKVLKRTANEYTPDEAKVELEARKAEDEATVAPAAPQVRDVKEEPSAEKSDQPSEPIPAGTLTTGPQPGVIVQKEPGKSPKKKPTFTGEPLEDPSADRVRKEVLKTLLALQLQKKQGLKSITPQAIDRMATLVGLSSMSFGEAIGLTAEEFNALQPIAPVSQEEPTGKSFGQPAKGKALAQPPRLPTDQGKRGFTQPLTERLLVALTSKADFSTWLHELGHVWLIQAGRVYDTLKSTPPEALNPAQKSFLERSEAILSWLGVKDFTSITEEQHEKFARAIETYFAKGQAPNSKLRAAFDMFKKWMLALYGFLRGWAPLDPSVRNFVDHLLASHEEVILARRNEAMGSPIAEAAIEAMGEAQAGKFAKAQEKFTEAVEEEKLAQDEAVAKKVMESVEREKDKGFQEALTEVKKEVAQEVGAEREYLALGYFQSNPTLKFSTAGVEAISGKEAAKILERKGLASKDGVLTPRFVQDVLYAEGIEFTSGDEVVQSLANLEDFNAKVERVARERMKDIYGDVLEDGGLLDEVISAMHTPESAERMHLEADWLFNKAYGTGQSMVKTMAAPPKSRPEVTQAAVARVSAMSNRKISAWLSNWNRARKTAAREALDKFLKGDWLGAFQAKMRELEAHELYRAGASHLALSERMAEQSRGYSRPLKRAQFGKAGDEYLRQIDSIGTRYDFYNRSETTERKLASLREFLKQHAEDTHMEIEVPDHLIAESQKVNWRDIPVNDLVDIANLIKRLDRQAKLKNKLLRAQAKREFDATRDEAVASIKENFPKKFASEKEREEFEAKQRDKARGAKAASGVLKEVGSSFLAWQRKLQSFLEQMDGWKTGGVLWELFGRPINEAGTAEAVMNEEATIALKKLVDLYSLGERGDLFEKKTVDVIKGSLSKMDRIMIALNWGNEENRERLLSGEGWNEAQVLSILEDLDQRDWDFVKGVWAQLESYWPKIKALAERVDGIAPDKVEATPYMTKFGEVPGGYFPIRYMGGPSFIDAKEATDRAMRGKAIRSTTRHDHRKARSEGTGKRLLLDPKVIFDHVSSVIHDLTHYEMLVDAHRMLHDSKLQAAIKTYYGDTAWKEMEAVFNDVAAGPIGAKNAAERVMNYLRSGTSMAVMGYNVLTAMKQPLGLITSAQYLGAKWVARGIGAWMGSAQHQEYTLGWVHKKSDMMRLRYKTAQREISEERNKLEASFAGPVREKWDWVQRHGYDLIGRAQLIADVPTWLGAYLKAMEEGPKPKNEKEAEEFEKRAFALADQAVIDTQGSGQLKDLSRVQRGGPWLKALAMFFTFGNARFQRTLKAVAGVKGVDDVPKLLVDLLTLYWLPTTIGFITTSLLRGDDEEIKERVKKLGRAGVSDMFSDVFFLRELSGVVQGYDYRGPAGWKFVSSLQRLGEQIGQGQADEALRRAALEVTGILFHYPSRQVEAFASGLGEMLEGESRNPLQPILGESREK